MKMAVSGDKKGFVVYKLINRSAEYVRRKTRG